MNLGAAASSRGDSGFFTPVFAVAGMALALVSVAAATTARANLVAARAASEASRTQWLAEAAAQDAAWRILHAKDSVASTWRYPNSGRAFEVLAEPEARKLSVGEIEGLRGRQALAAAFGEKVADAAVARLSSQLKGRRDPPPRRLLVGASTDARWQACAPSLLSAYSRATDFGVEGLKDLGWAPLHLRAGEVWRIRVAGRRAVLIDQLIRLSGDPASPAQVIDELPAGGSPADCWSGPAHA